MMTEKERGTRRTCPAIIIMLRVVQTQIVFFLSRFFSSSSPQIKHLMLLTFCRGTFFCCGRISSPNTT